MKIGIIWTDCVRFAALVGSGGREKKGSDLCPLSSFTFLPIYLYLHGQNEITWPESIPMFLSQVSTVNLPQATGQCGALMTRRAH